MDVGSRQPEYWKWEFQKPKYLTAQWIYTLTLNLKRKGKYAKILIRTWNIGSMARCIAYGGCCSKCASFIMSYRWLTCMPMMMMHTDITRYFRWSVSNYIITWATSIQISSHNRSIIACCWCGYHCCHMTLWHN